MKTHYSYLRDPSNTKRVITVARKIEDGKITFGLAVCRPPEWRPEYTGDPTYKTYYLDKGDQHVKKTGRSIAEGRMNHPTKSLRILRIDGEHPMRTIAFNISYGHLGPVPTFVQRTFLDYLDNTAPTNIFKNPFAATVSLA
jgi:hypothetical protein